MSGVPHKVSRDYYILRSACATVIIRIFASECHKEATKDWRERKSKSGETSSDDGATKYK